MKVFILLCLLSSAAAWGEGAKREMLAFPGSGKKVEFYSQRPEGRGPFPAILLIHPSQEGTKNGGKFFVENGSMKAFVDRGFYSFAISQPGFGASDGKADFCGPGSQAAVHLLLDQIRLRPGINKKSIFLYGGSRGAVVAAMAATQQEGLAGVILKSGVYDFASWFRQASWLSGVKWAYLLETGWPSAEKFRERSALLAADKIKAPLLILHGTRDERAPIESAIALAESVQASGGWAELYTFDAGHFIPAEKVAGPIAEFLLKKRK